MEPHVAGYRTRIGDVPALLTRLRAHEAETGMQVQLVRADRVHGADHLRLAARLAARAIEQERGRAADVATETLLYAAGERQIGRALERMGLAPGMEAVAAVAWGEATALDAWAAQEGWTRSDDVLKGEDTVLDLFGVTMEERALLPRERWGDLVLERVALVDVAKP